MAFPSEVTMIPAFLLLKRFPLWPLVGGAAAFGLSVWITFRLLRRFPETVRMVISLAVGVAAGLWLVPAITGKPHVSLLNTFAALVLPGMANGYMIFLLKGFFDTLPRDLFEAADIDGASEWTKFWSFAMGLSKPILAVIALGAFTGAYTEFMMALIIIPEPNMWTIMVWLFQLQHFSHQSVVYASLVIAAIPTFLARSSPTLRCLAPDSRRLEDRLTNEWARGRRARHADAGAPGRADRRRLSAAQLS